MFFRSKWLIVVITVIFLPAAIFLPAVSAQETGPDAPYRVYFDFFQKVYEKMEQEYYMPVSPDAYAGFLEKFKAQIYPELQKQSKSQDFIRWRSAAYLVEDLKTEEDKFSAFYPPKPAREYAQEALGVKIDLGITGMMAGIGFAVTNVEPHSNSYQQGLRPRDVIVQIDETAVSGLTQQKVEEKLRPLAGSKVTLVYFTPPQQEIKTIEVISEEYFKQTVFMCPVDAPGIYCLQIPKFNKKTADDLLSYLVHIHQRGDDRGLILDFRNNPGGPPLAAREMSAFFLTPKEEFAYFQRRGRPKSSLDIPEIPPKYRYTKPIVILINEKSGSASELFSGVMQRRERAYLIGVNSAGAVMLKSMFDFDDSSMLLLVTGRGYHPDGTAFSFDGVTPNKTIESDQDLIDAAAKYLLSVIETKK